VADEFSTKVDRDADLTVIHVRGEIDRAAYNHLLQADADQHAPD